MKRLRVHSELDIWCLAWRFGVLYLIVDESRLPDLSDLERGAHSYERFASVEIELLRAAENPEIRCQEKCAFIALVLGFGVAEGNSMSELREAMARCREKMPDYNYLESLDAETCKEINARVEQMENARMQSSID